MASRDLTYTIGVDASDAAAGLRKLESAVRSTMRTVDDTLEDGASAGDKFASSIDRVAQTLREDMGSAATAAEELKRALRDAGSSLDVGDAITSLRRMGISFDEITVDADKLASSLKQLDDVRAQGVADLDAVAPGLASKLDDVTKSADSSKSALANMVGNSTQSLGELAGVTGDLGVGIGQIGEYFADAAFEGEKLGSVVASFAKVAGPMAALAAATALVGSVLSARGKASEAEADQVERLTDAYRSGVAPAEAYADALRDMGEIVVGLNRNAKTSEQGGIIGWIGGLSESLGPFGGALQMAADKLGIWGEATGDIVPLLGKAGVTVDQWTAAVMGGADAYDRFARGLAETNLSEDERAQVLAGLRDEQEASNEATANASRLTAVFGDANEEAALSVEELTQAQLDAQEAADAHKLSILDATKALGELRDSIADMRVQSLRSVFELGNAPAEASSQYRDVLAAIDELSDSADGLDLSKGLNVDDVSLDPLLDKLDSLRPQIQAQLVTAFSEGGPEAAAQWAGTFVDQIYDELGGKVSKEDIAKSLGIDDIEATIGVALDESAKAAVLAQLDALVGIGGETPFTASVRLAVQAGSLSTSAAQAIAAWALEEQGVDVPFEPVTDPAALAEAQAFMSQHAAANPIPQPFNADVSQLDADAAAARAKVGDTPATIPFEGDPSEAEDEAEGFRSKTDKTKATVGIDASTAAAAAILLAFLTVPRKAPVYIDVPNASAADQVLDAVAAPRRSPVDVYVRDYPSASEIQAMIGRPRIPVDIVVGQSIRITGVRE